MIKLISVCSCFFGVAIALGSGDAIAQSMSTSNCVAVGPNIVHCDTMNMIPQASPAPAPAGAIPTGPLSEDGTVNPGLWGLLPKDKQDNPVRDTIGAIGDAFLVGGGRQPTYARYKQMRAEQAFRMKVGKMLADGDCQGAARMTLESGRLELGQKILATCHSDSAQTASASPH